VVDADGNAIEVTWTEPGVRYYGETFIVAELTNLGGPVLDERAVDALRAQAERADGGAR
jgi:hypothetical protein